jgi:hypothetical protein
MTRMVEDCFSSHLDLMLLCPNGVNQDGVNTDKYLPNPRHVSPRAIAMFELVGRIMGCSLRLKMCLPFHFPSLVTSALCSLSGALSACPCLPAEPNVACSLHTNRGDYYPVALACRSGSCWWVNGWTCLTLKPSTRPPPRSVSRRKPPTSRRCHPPLVVPDCQHVRHVESL